MAETLKEKTSKGLFWGGISNLVQQAVGMIFGIIIARILSPEDYGVVAMLAIFVSVANTIMDSGFSTALVNCETIEHKDYNAVFWFNVFVGIAMYIILFFSAPLIADFYHLPVLKDLSRIVFLSCAFACTGVAHNAFLTKKIMAKQRGIIGIVAVVCSGIVGLILALNGFAFWGLAVQQVLQTLIIVLLRWYFSSWRPTFEFDFSPLKAMFAFSIKLFITNIFAQVTSNLFSVILGRMYGKVETGYYSQGSKWAVLSNSVIAGTINGIAQPVLVEARDDIKRQLHVFRKMLRFGAFITFPALCCLAFVGKEFILILLDEKWVNSVSYLQLFCIWGIGNSLSAFYIMLLFSHGKSNTYMNMMIALFVMQLLCLYLCSSFGIYIMVCVYVAISLLSILGWQYFAHQLIGIRLRDLIKDIFPYLMATGISIGVAWMITNNFSNLYLKFIIKVLVVISVYCLILWKLNSVIFKESIRFFLKKK